MIEEKHHQSEQSEPLDLCHSVKPLDLSVRPEKKHKPNNYSFFCLVFDKNFSTLNKKERKIHGSRMHEKKRNSNKTEEEPEEENWEGEGKEVNEAEEETDALTFNIFKLGMSKGSTSRRLRLPSCCVPSIKCEDGHSLYPVDVNKPVRNIQL